MALLFSKEHVTQRWSETIKKPLWFSSNFQVLVQMFRNLHEDVSIWEGCIQWLFPNITNFLCQAYGIIVWGHYKFQDFLTSFAVYFILFLMTTEFNSVILYTNILIFEQSFGIGVYLWIGS
jgi:hypothetical protein